ncbi:hypothetical protein O6H91_06G073400 [Diphasiastrum complanatum]|uniref:Uncharacterized protein n=1 Tax=Diphasiastrum complanatum TaxID=34168 RepID=A0ACC2DF86_DIPCM|nr:hypothetical protein O6H91_06G073400 [Diphasiastrum complanatum]
MDGSSEEEEYEYFETSEVMSSASTSDSGSEVDQALRKRQLKQAGKPPSGALNQANSDSKYAVWRNDSRSIRERRQELFQLMGLQDQRHYHKAADSDSSPFVSVSGTGMGKTEGIGGSSSKSTSFSAPTASRATPVSSESSSVTVALQSSLSLSSMKTVGMVATVDLGGFGRSASLEEVSSTKQSLWTIARSRSDGKGRDVLLRRIAKSPDKPVLERFLETSGAVLREGPGFSYQLEVQKEMHNTDFQIKQKEGSSIADFQLERLKTKLPVPLPLGSLFHEGKVSASPTEPSSCSERSIAEILQGGEDHIEDPRSSKEVIQELVCRIKDLDTGKEFVVHELGTDGLWNKLREVGTGKEFTLEEFEKSLGLSPISKEVRKRVRAAGAWLENAGSLANADGTKRKKKGWLRSIKNVAHYVKGPKEKLTGYSNGEEGLQKSGSKRGESPDFDQSMPSWRPQKVKVRMHRKETKEFSELYMGQEFRGHEGPIWALKFSLDGRHLATGGQDCVVRVWEAKDHRSMRNRGSDDALSSKILDLRPSQENGTSQVSKSLWIWSDERRSRRAALSRSNSAKAVQPPKLFSIVEKAIRCFNGHTEDILDLAWSRSQFLLSSSMDKTVRLWHVLHEECLRIFSHRDYVTCIEFNPVDDRYFISGSLDDKVRIWSILDHQVVDWMDMREMVTAACYTPDGQGAVVGTFKGTCRTYKITGNKLQLEAHIAVLNVKGRKSRGKKITGLQFMCGNTTKLLVTSNDSRIRVFDGVELECKLKGFRNVSSQMSASFSADGHYIVSASEDSRVYIWNFVNASSNNQKAQRKKAGQAFESFYSQNVTVAISWPRTSLLSTSDTNKEVKGDRQSVRQLEATTIEPLICRDVLDIHASSPITSISRCDHEHDIPIGCASNSKMTSKQSSFASMYFDCPAASVGVAGDAIERAGAETSSTNGYLSWTNKIGHSQTSATEFSASDLLSAADSCLVCSPTSQFTEKDLSCIHSVLSNGSCHSDCETGVIVSTAWSRFGPKKHCLKSSPEVDAADAHVSTGSLAAEDMSKTQVTMATPACDLIIVTASLDGDIRIFQNSRAVF